MSVQKLNYPIEFYAQKRIALFLSVVGMLGFSIMFAEVFLIYPHLIVVIYRG